MRLALLIRPALILACSFLAASGTAQATDRPAKEILDEIRLIRTPQLTTRERQDPEKVRVFKLAQQATLDEKATLIGELIRVDPSSPELAKLAPVRWRAIQGTPAGAAATKAEIEAILRKNENPKLVVEAAYFQASMTVDSLGAEPRFDAMMPPIRAFTSRFPDDKRGATLLKQAAARLDDPARKTALLESIEEQYPDGPEAMMKLAERKQAARVGKPFDLEFADAITGTPVSIKQLKGSVVVIDFWATWCGPCVAEMPRLKELYAKYHDQGVEFIGISLDQPKDQGGLDKLKEFVAERKLAWPQYYQGNGGQSEFSMSWNIVAIPTMFLIDADGNLASVEAREKLEELLPKYLEKAKKPL